MVATYPVCVAVPRSHYDIELRVHYFCGCCDRQRPAVQPLETVSIHEMRKLGSAPYSGNYERVLRVKVHVGYCPFHYAQYAEITASCAPRGRFLCSELGHC